MNTFDTRNNNKNLSIVAAVFIGIFTLFGLQGCFHDDDDDPAAIDASGLYTDGNATIDGTDVSDLTAIIYNDRLMMFTSTLNVLYDGTIVEKDDGSFTSTVDIYVLGAKEAATADITGNIDNRSQVTGTIVGTGVGNASFTLMFNDLYDRDATLPRIVTDGGAPLWLGEGSSAGGTLPDDRLEMDFLTSNLLNIEVAGSFLEAWCKSKDASFTLASQSNIYHLSTELENVISSCQIIGTNYTGFATVIDSDPTNPNTDDLLIMAISNGTNSVFGFINK